MASATSPPSPPPGSSLTADDLVRTFNDPEGELLQYAFKPIPGEKWPEIDEAFRMEVPYEAIKQQVEEITKDIRDRLDPTAPVPAFEHVGSTSIKGELEGINTCKEIIVPNHVDSI